jgi:hypothetical protein
LTYETESACGVQDKFFRWIYFLYVCAFLFRRVFDYGLPLRGAITKGRCLIVETVFAGKPILEAHQICSRLNLAGCVITDEALTWAKEGDIDIGKDRVCLSSEWSHLLHYPYMVPEKEGKSSKRQVLNLALFSEAFGNTWDGDLRQIVCSSFGKHNKDKDIKGDVLEKINNTEQYLKFLKNRYPRGFKPKDKAQ